MKLITTRNKPKIFNANQFLKAIKSLSSTKKTSRLSDKEIDRHYRAAMMKKHGKYLLKLGYFGKTKISDHV